MCDYKWLINVIMSLKICYYRITTSLINKIQRDINHSFRVSKVAEQVYIMLTFFIAIWVNKTLGLINFFFTCVRYFYMFVLECPTGYFLKNCSRECSPPNYGEKCQSICACPDEDCHFATGCLQHMDTVAGYRLSSIFI